MGWFAKRKRSKAAKTSTLPDGAYVRDEPDGTRLWYDSQDRFHREDGPAVEWGDGSGLEWFIEGKLHREDGPAFTAGDGFLCEWHRHGQLHREDGPAVEGFGGHAEWWQNGRRHREDGPAVEAADGTREWYLDGEALSEEEWRNVLPTRALAAVVVTPGQRARPSSLSSTRAD